MEIIIDLLLALVLYLLVLRSLRAIEDHLKGIRADLALQADRAEKQRQRALEYLYRVAAAAPATRHPSGASDPSAQD